jgi:hypothetical protein
MSELASILRDLTVLASDRQSTDEDHQRECYLLYARIEKAFPIAKKSEAKK